MKTGDKWHEWTVTEFIGAGNFGNVYRIERQEYGHTYVSALKELHVPQSQAELDAIRKEGLDEISMTEYFQGMVENIMSEIVLMESLKGNSNIVSYEDHEVVKSDTEIGWDVYIRMELLIPLYDYFQTHTMTVKDVISMGVDICNALELCEKRHIIHRDIKPENIFYSSQGSFKLGDFGIARELEMTTDSLTRTGTPSYIAPEVFKGKPYDSTVDIYSLGIVLYRFLNNNRTPLLPDYPKAIQFGDRQYANMRRMEGHELPVPCNASGKLGEIILKACAYDPADRYQNAEALRSALTAVLDEQDETVVMDPEKVGSAHSAEGRSIDSDIEKDSETAVTVPMVENEINRTEARRRKPLLLIAIPLVVLCGCLLIKFFIMDSAKVFSNLDKAVSIEFYGMDGYGWYEVTAFDPSVVKIGRTGKEAQNSLGSLDYKVELMDSVNGQLSNGDKVRIRLIYDKEKADKLGVSIDNDTFETTVTNLGERFENGNDIPDHAAKSIMKRLKKEALYTAQIREYGQIELEAVYFMKDTAKSMESDQYAYADGIVAFFSYENNSGEQCYFYERIRPICKSTNFDLLEKEYEGENKERNFLNDNSMGSDNWKDSSEVQRLEDAIEKCEEHRNNQNYELIELDFDAFSQYYLE